MSNWPEPQRPPRETEALMKAIADAAERPAGSLPAMGQMSTYSFVLPTNVLSVGSSVVDDFVKRALEPSGLINWCSTIKRILPVYTRGDGNCLLHAISLYLWGVDDGQYVLRRLVSEALQRDLGPIKARWQRQVEKESSAVPGGVQMSDEEWRNDWDSVVRLVSDGDRQQPGQWVNSLEAVHVFVIANVLRRPVLVYGEAVVRDVAGCSFSPNNIVGAYLPLLNEPSECTRSPVLLAFHGGHFVPLLSVEDDANTVAALAPSGLHAAPLVLRSLEQLRVHFLLGFEEPRVFDLLHSFFNLDEAPFAQHDSIQSILFARLTLRRLPESMRVASLPQPAGQASRSAAASEPAAGEAAGSNWKPSPSAPPAAAVAAPARAAEPTAAAPPARLPAAATAIVGLAPAAAASVVGRRGRVTSERASQLGAAAFDAGASEAFDYWPDPAEGPARGRQLSADDLEPLRQMSLSGAPCLTDGCLYYSSLSTFPHCHECSEQLKLSATASVKGVFRVSATDTFAESELCSAANGAATAGGDVGGPLSPASRRRPAAGVAGQPLAGVICMNYNCQSLASIGTYPYCRMCMPSNTASTAAAAVASCESSGIAPRPSPAGSLARGAPAALQPAPGEGRPPGLRQQQQQPPPSATYRAVEPIASAAPGLGSTTGSVSRSPGTRPTTREGGGGGGSSWIGSAAGREQLPEPRPWLPASGSAEATREKGEGAQRADGDLADAGRAALAQASRAGLVGKCVYPECTNRGLDECGGLCKECHDIISAAKQKQRQKRAPMDVPLCCHPSGCNGVGHTDLDGLCQKHFKGSYR